MANIQLFNKNYDSIKNINTDINSGNKSGKNMITFNNESQKTISPTIYIKKNIKKNSVSMSRNHFSKNVSRNIGPPIPYKNSFNYETLDSKKNFKLLRKRNISLNKKMKNIKLKLSNNTIYRSPLLNIININQDI